MKSIASVLAFIALPGVVAGCSAPTAPPPPPGGGATPTLSFALFETTVAPVLTRRGCDATGDCHGGGIRGSLELSPPGAKDTRFDFEQVSLQVSLAEPDASPVLTEPLALDAGGSPHPYKTFAAPADTDYQAIRGWILDGVGR